jgi:hypothetical protein
MIPSLNVAENELLATMLRGNRKIELAVPDTLEPKEVISAVRSCCSMLQKSERVQGKLLAVLGRLMVLARNNDLVWTESGYKSYGEFVKKELEVKLGRSRSSLYEAKKIIETFPDLDLNTYGKIPTASLLLAAKCNPTGAQRVKMLERAAGEGADAFKEWVVEKGYLGSKEDNTGATLILSGSLSKIKELRRFLAREDVRKHVGSEDPLEIILAATQEVDAEWADGAAKA